MQLNSENEDKAKVYLETLRIDKISSERLQKNFKKVFRAYSPKKASNFVKKEALAQVFSCEFCEIFKNTFFTEHVWATASLPK